MIYDKYAFKVPECKQVRVITDTDAKNEADDQFCIVQTLLSPKVDNVGFIAAHFGLWHYEDSMMRSYRELEKVFDIMGFDKKDMIFKVADKPLAPTASPYYLPKPEDSEGARLIIREAMKDDPRPLFVTFLGPITDLASAYLIEPRIAGRLTAIWIGGGKYPEGGLEFNGNNDIAAANVIFGSNIDLWQVPQNAYEYMTVSFAELEAKVRPCGKIGKYLFDQMMEHFAENASGSDSFRSGETWVLGDNPAIGLILYEHRCHYDIISAPLMDSEMHYIHSGRNRGIRVYKWLDSRLILEDMFSKIKLFAEKQG
ncbi:MAG: nucleoside hydrolase [Spirochaetaceae bacterium]|jgi:inosine-uridine nucleoside N-ribohydrolase|nr:nucleoside hydrolase [Spirochaetaceae bacterium]